jgi:hypothetical protein
MRIEIKAVDPIALREKSAWLKDGSLQVLVPDYGRNHDGAFLVGLYELVKAWQCHKAHIPEGAVKLKQEIVAAEVERNVADALEIDWEQHEKWVENSYDEVARSSAIEAPRILLQGPRAWAELHLFALRHEAKRQGVSEASWFENWVSDLPFDGCPCKGHLHEFLAHNPPDWDRFFAWSVNLHNAVNARIGKLTIGVEQARELWSSRLF